MEETTMKMARRRRMTRKMLENHMRVCRLTGLLKEARKKYEYFSYSNEYWYSLIAF
jgi:hypothetical protein